MCEFCDPKEGPASIIPAMDDVQLQIDVGIEIRHDKNLRPVDAVLCASLLYEWDDLTTTRVKINYCPICGRKFEEVEE